MGQSRHEDGAISPVQPTPGDATVNTKRRLRSVCAAAGRLAGLAWLGLILALAPAAAASEPARVIVFAAASMADAVQSLAARYNRRGDAEVVPSFAASSVLARQIENGAPADIYISANRRWMDYLDERGLVDAGSRCDLVSNRLVLIAPQNSALSLRVTPGFALADALGADRLAIGDPDHVPAGLYARQALESLGVWAQVEDRLVRTADVRAALAIVARGESAAGVVYATDAALSERVRIVDTFPPASHAPIVYPVARVAGAGRAEATAFFAYLVSAEGRAEFERFGFETTGSACSP